MGLQRIIKASSGASLTPSKIKFNLGDKTMEVTPEEFRQAYMANPLSSRDEEDRQLTEEAMQYVMGNLSNATISGSPGIDSLGKFDITGSADIYNLSKDATKKKLYNRVSQIIGNVAMRQYNNYKAPEEAKPKEAPVYDYDTRSKTRGMQYSFFKNNEDSDYQLSHLTGKYRSGKAYQGAMYDTQEKRQAQFDNYFRDIYENEVLKEGFDGSKYGYNKDEFTNLYNQYNTVGQSPEQKIEAGAKLAMLLGEGSNYNKLLNPTEYIGTEATSGGNYGATPEEPKSEYTDIGNGMYSTQKDGKTYIGTKEGEKFTPVTSEGTYGGYVVGSDGALMRSNIPEVNDFASAAEFANNPYMVFNGKKLYTNSPEYINGIANKDPKAWIEENKKAIYGDMVPSDEMLQKDINQLSLFNSKQYFNKPIKDLEIMVNQQSEQRKLKLVDSKNNAANKINIALDNSLKQNVFDISDYFDDDDHSYFFTYKVDKQGRKSRVLVKAKRDGAKLTDIEKIPMSTEMLKKLSFAKEKKEFMKRDYLGDDMSKGFAGFSGLGEVKTIRKPATKSHQLGGNLIKEDSPLSVNVENPAKGDRAEMSAKTDGIKFKDVFDDDNTAYDNQLMISGLLDITSMLSSLLPSTGISNVATGLTGIAGTALKGYADYTKGNKALSDVLLDGAGGAALDLVAALPGVGILGTAGKAKKAAGFYRKFLAPGMALSQGLSLAQQGVLDKIFSGNLKELTLDDAQAALGLISGLKRTATNIKMNKSFKKVDKSNLDLTVKVKGQDTKISLDPNKVTALKKSDNQVEAFKKLVAKETNASLEDIDFNNLVKDGSKIQAKFWKGMEPTENLNFKLDNPSTTYYDFGDYDKLNRWGKFVARDQFQPAWGLPFGRKPKPFIENVNVPTEQFKKGGILKFSYGGYLNPILGNSAGIEAPKHNRMPGTMFKTPGSFATEPIKFDAIDPLPKAPNPLDRFNSTLQAPDPRFKFGAEAEHLVTKRSSPKISTSGLGVADVLDFTNLLYANKQTDNLKQYTNYKPALSKAPRMATPSVSINGVEESNARRRIAEINSAKPQYASAEQALMNRYAMNSQGNEMSRQIGQSISSQLEQKKEAYRQAVNQQSMINADVDNRNAAAISANNNMQLNARGELAKTIFQNNSNYLTRMAQNQRMKDERREMVVNQKRALEYNANPVNMMNINEARVRLEEARQAAGGDINNVAYRNAQMELDNLIRMNELSTEAIKNGVIL